MSVAATARVQVLHHGHHLIRVGTRSVRTRANTRAHISPLHSASVSLHKPLAAGAGRSSPRAHQRASSPGVAPGSARLSERGSVSSDGLADWERNLPSQTRKQQFVAGGGGERAEQAPAASPPLPPPPSLFTEIMRSSGGEASLTAVFPVEALIAGRHSPSPTPPSSPSRRGPMEVSHSCRLNQNEPPRGALNAARLSSNAQSFLFGLSRKVFLF